MKTARVLVVCAILSVLLCTIAFSTEQTPGDSPTPEDKMGYANPEARLIPFTAYKGKSYRDKVPDTIDIAEMAKLTINALTGCTDPNADHGMYFSASFGDTSTLSHNGADACQVKFMEALPLLRIASGSTLNQQVDKVWMESIQKSIGPDGLYYLPLKGLPWLHADEWHAEFPVSLSDGKTIGLGDPSITQVTYSYVFGRMLNIMIIYYLRDGNPAWKEMAKRLVDRMNELCIDKGDYCYLPAWGFAPNAKLPADAPMPKGGLAALDFVGRLQEGLGKFYGLTGYEPAKKLGQKLTNFMRYHADYYDDQGRAPRSDFEATQFHAHTIGLLSMLEYATAAGDRDTLEYVHKAFGWWKDQGWSVTGFFPEGLMTDDSPGVYGNSCESCEVADMIAIGLKLTDAGMGDYWDDVDKWIRNQFVENQLTNIGWIKDVSPAVAAKASEGFNIVNASDVPGERSTTSHVAERCLGSFAGYAAPNDWGAPGLMHCCTGNAARSIYYVWEHILDSKNGRLRVNLLMNRASEWADVYSYVPYEGKVDLKIKKNFKNVLIRMPEWVKGSEIGIACVVNGQPRDLKWKGRYVDLGSAVTGDKVSVTFPIYEWTTRLRMFRTQYKLVIKGNTVVSIDPPGTTCPTYQREKYRKNKAHWKTVKRFVSNQRIEW